MSEPIIRIRNAHKYYNKGRSNEIHVMNDVSLELPEAGMVAVFGRSGCGKTTLLAAIGGLDSIAGGSIELFGQNIRKHTDILRNKYVGYIFQNYNLNARQTVFENVSAALRLCGMRDEEEIATRTLAALRNVDMEKYRDRTPDTLSGGQQQRVAIARALVKCPAIILADEPTGNLDEENTVLVMDILKELSRTRLVLLVTHEADLVDHYCDRVIEIVDGRIHGDKTNEDAKGYVQRSKNDIYLGELSKETTETPGVRVEYYGSVGEEITLQVVNVGGRLYLKSSDPTVMLLDERSEVKLVDGVFEATPAPEAAPKRSLDLSALTPFEGKRFGRLFHFKNALASAWRDNFSAKKKAGRVLLSLCLILLAMTLVTLTAVVGTGLDGYIRSREDHDPHQFYIPLDPEENYTPVMQGIGKSGMDSAVVVEGVEEREVIQFRTATFMTAKVAYLTADGYISDVRLAKDLPVVAGTKTLNGDGDILITTAVADKMLTDSPVEYLDGYKDLIGMVSSTPVDTMGNMHVRIAGVVESDSLFIYANSLMAARNVLTGRMNYMPIAPASDSVYGRDLKAGEMIIIYDEYQDFGQQTGDTVTVLGRDFRVVKYLKEYTSVDQFLVYVNEYHGVILSANVDEYIQETGISADIAPYAYYLEYLFPYMSEFCAHMMTARLRQGMYVEQELWAVVEKQSVSAYATLLGMDFQSTKALCAAYLFHEDTGHYPNGDEMEAFCADSLNADRLDKLMDSSVYWVEYEAYQNEMSNKSSYYYYVISDEDYIALASSVGKTTMDSIQPYAVWEGFAGTTYTHHLMISSSDPDSTEAYLTGCLGEDGFISPDEVLRSNLNQIQTLTLIGFVGILVVLALMCLCMYFIMHAIFVSRIREVGIYRAIGVTKKNILFRFGVETALVSMLTVALGFGLSTWMVTALAGTPVFADLFFFPFWMAVLLFGLLMTSAFVFGILPALALLRKTPAAILAKYDI